MTPISSDARYAKSSIIAARFVLSLITSAHLTCRQDCQKNAWTRHHKWECKVLNSLRGTANERATLNADFRCILRLILLHQNKKLSVQFGNEILSLKTTGEKTLARNKYDESAQSMAIILLLCTYKNTDITGPQIVQLVLKVSIAVPEKERFLMTTQLNNNGVGIDIPVLRGRRLVQPLLGYSIRAGWCFEPFVSMINHSCEPDAWWVFEGKELRVRAAVDISTDEELTFTYVGGQGEYGKRRDFLESNWGIRCTCVLCSQGNRTPLSLPKGLQDMHLHCYNNIQ